MGFVLLLLYIIVSFIYPGEIFPALAPYRITYWVGMAGLASSVVWLVARKAAPISTVQLWFLGAFTLVLGVSRMIADSWLGAPVMAVQRFGPSLTMFVLTVCCVTTLQRLRIAGGLVVALAMILLAQGMAVYHLGINSNMFIYDSLTRAEYVASAEDNNDVIQDDEGAEDVSEEDAAADVKRIRGLGLFADPNDLAMGLVVALALMGGAWTTKAPFKNLFLVILPAAALGYGVFLTHSRGGTVAFLMVLWRAAANRMGRAKGIMLLALLAGAAVALDFGGGRQIFSTTDDSALGRLDAWTEGWQMLKSQPILGVGYGMFLEYHRLTAHNSFVLCFAESGLVGYFFWLGLSVVTYLQLESLKKLPGTEAVDRGIERWATTLQLALVGYMTAAFFLSRTFVPILYLVLGLSVALVLIARQENRPVWSPSWVKLGSIVLGAEFSSIVLIYLIIKFHIGIV